jgi:hypothetical protein
MFVKNIESQRRYRTFLLALVYLIVMMMGIADRTSTYGMSEERRVLYSLALALVLTQACIVDCRITGKPLSIFSYWLVFMFYGIAVPISIIQARGLRGLIYVTAHFLGIALVLIISICVSYLVLVRF